MSADAIKVAPDVYHVVFENAKIRVLQAKLKRGQKSAMHKHPSNFVFVLQSGQVAFTSPDGKTQKVRMKEGDVMWFDEQEHASQNVGTKTARVLIVEIK
jgi:quercetin dioxygenase-like cupin family protein